MKLVVFTQQEDRDAENEEIVRMFEAGLTTLHIRKPKYNIQQMRSFIERIPEKYHSRMVLHSHHQLAYQYRVKGIHLTESRRGSIWGFVMSYLLIYKFSRRRMSISTSVHTLQVLKKIRRGSYSYVFLSPVFKSLSKEDYKPSFKLAKVQDTLREAHVRVYALGGVDAPNIHICSDVGFLGVGVLGSVWHDPDPIRKFKELKEICSSDMISY